MRGRDIAVILGVVLLAIIVLGLLVGGMMWPGMMGCCGFGFFPWWGIVMLLFWALIVGGIVALVVWLVRQSIPAVAPTAAPGARALEILKERYARGELTREQFEQMRRELEGK